MLNRKKFKLCLKQCKRGAQFVCGIAGELPLCREPLVKSVKHLIKRNAELLELGRHIIGYLHIGQVIRMNIFNP